MATMARFPHGDFSKGAPEWLTFVREVNGVLPGTFGAPKMVQDEPHPGYETEKYPGARVIHGPRSGDEGVRIVADTDEVRDAFRTVAAQMHIHLAETRTP